MPFTPSAHTGTIHRFTPTLIAFEHNAPASSPPSTKNTNTLLWIGGLSDGLLTVTYPTTLAAHHLPPSWRLAQPLLSSSYTGWGQSSLARDAAELARCVAYFRALRPGGRVVLMGHSTGCQDAVEYVTGAASSAESKPSPPGEPREAPPAEEERPRVDGIVLQAPASDREALVEAMGGAGYEEANRVARGLVEAGRGEDTLPKAHTRALFGDALVGAGRWLSLASPEKRGADDFFSSDLPDERVEGTFGTVPEGVKVCVLYSGEDEFVPGSVDKEGLVGRWRGVMERKGKGAQWDGEFGGVVPGASHNLGKSGEKVVEDLCRRVVGFLGTIAPEGQAHI